MRTRRIKRYVLPPISAGRCFKLGKWQSRLSEQTDMDHGFACSFNWRGGWFWSGRQVTMSLAGDLHNAYFSHWCWRNFLNWL